MYEVGRLLMKVVCERGECRRLFLFGCVTKKQDEIRASQDNIKYPF